MTYEQFEEIVEEAINNYISRNEKICNDRKWENENAAKNICLEMRKLSIPLIPLPKKE